MLKENDVCSDMAGKTNTAAHSVSANATADGTLTSAIWVCHSQMNLPSQKQCRVIQFITYKPSSVIEDFHFTLVSFSEMKRIISKDFDEDPMVQ